MSVAEPVAGILLAGGRSSRMGGGDKGMRLLGGRPILARVIERLKPQVSHMVINANGDPFRLAEFNLPVVPDRISGFAGPLAGVHAGLEWVTANCPGVAHAITVATDTPFLPADLVQRFLAGQGEGPRLCVARSEAGTHPVIGLWPVGLASALEESLKAGERKVGKWVAEHGAIEVFFPDLEIGGTKLDPFFNINRPEDLALADDLLREQAR
jgi:molybdopterin-guanine dinucleotide biosynthesis protein A